MRDRRNTPQIGHKQAQLAARENRNIPVQSPVISLAQAYLTM
jgi:hypothetical protein